MGDAPASFGILPGSAIHMGSPASLMSDGLEAVQSSLTLGGAYPTASLALFFPFITDVPILVTQISHENSSTVSGNVDVGIYDELGNRKVSKGGVAQTGTITIQVHDVTDTLLSPGVYYMAFVLDNATGQVNRATTPAAVARSCGAKEMASAYPLPATATFAGCTTAYQPAMSVHTMSAAV
jgi:hypothetical protein